MIVTCVIAIASALAQRNDMVILCTVGACAGLLVSFVLFLASIRREYIATFYDTRTATQHNAKRFFDATNDQMKFEILGVNELLRRDIRGDVKSWLEERLPSWLEEQPTWLTAYKKSLVPDWAIDDKVLLASFQGGATPREPSPPNVPS